MHGDGSPTKRFARDTSGNATAEFVIWLPMVLLAFGLTVDVSMIFHSQSQVPHVQTRTATPRSAGCTSEEAEDYIENRLHNASASAHASLVDHRRRDLDDGDLPGARLPDPGFFKQFNDLEITVNSEHPIENWGA
ncbi:MAG: TadE/TadG family type IV pilus assembly protein [Paracoccaceae bacterium]